MKALWKSLDEWYYGFQFAIDKVLAIINNKRK